MIGSSGLISSCYNGLAGINNQITVLGGTSFAAPIFAGFVAILNEVEHANGAGNIGPELYTLAANPTTYAAAFHDITTGTNACVTGAPGCSTAGQSNYQAMVGYDQATGLGSVDFNALATAWPSTTTNLIQTRMLLTAPAATAAPGATVPVQISVQLCQYVQHLLPRAAYQSPSMVLWSIRPWPCPPARSTTSPGATTNLQLRRTLIHRLSPSRRHLLRR